MKSSSGAATATGAATILRTSNTQRNIHPKLNGWDVSSLGYDVEKVVGKGSYGEVAKAMDRQNNRPVAIKRMKGIFNIASEAKRAYREMHILRHLHHPSVVSLLDVILPDRDSQSSSESLTTLGNLYLVFEFMDTDLAKVSKSQQFLSADHVQYMLYQMLDAMRFIHQSNVIHRDLKPANILVSCVDTRIKIADFGLSRVVGKELVVQHHNEPEAGEDESSKAMPGRGRGGCLRRTTASPHS
mmetsp:Transcript_6488/g.9043  ORF Transcript_6488/g.9043 Transcript_6488/m.9043 type:complete len:242 (-) Transcript_6488:14-739(-)